jgi:hypothetical protein
MKTMKRSFRMVAKGIILLILGTQVSSALDVPTYYNLDIQAMQMTLEGSKERLACLQRSCPLSEQYRIDDAVQQKIVELFASEGTTPSKHMGFYMQHSKEVKAYLENSSELQETYQSLQDSIESVNAELKTIMEAQ